MFQYPTTSNTPSSNRLYSKERSQSILIEVGEEPEPILVEMLEP